MEANEQFPVAKIDAVCHGLYSKTSSDDTMRGGLLKTLYICVGCKVMLTCNSNVKFGLFNGSSGTVMDIIYPVGKFPKDGHPICVMVEFQQNTGLPFIQENPNLFQ